MMSVSTTRFDEESVFTIDLVLSSNSSSSSTLLPEEETDVEILKNKIKILKKVVKKQQINEFKKKKEETESLYQKIQLIKQKQEIIAQQKKELETLHAEASERLRATFNLPPEETRKLLQNKRGRKRKIPTAENESPAQKNAKGSTILVVLSYKNN